MRADSLKATYTGSNGAGALQHTCCIARHLHEVLACMKGPARKAICSPHLLAVECLPNLQKGSGPAHIPSGLDRASTALSPDAVQELLGTG